MKNTKFILLLFCFLISKEIKAHIFSIDPVQDPQQFKVYGKITDQNGETLPYAYVIVDGTSNGTSSNSKGEYSIKLKKGTYTLAYQYLGFKKQFRQVDLSKDQEINVRMVPEEVVLKEVTITNKYKDPAYGIIKEAQKKRKDNLDAVQSYSCDVYIKGVGKLDEIPQDRPALLFFIPKDQMPDSTNLGMVYLSESKARLYVQKPDNVKEEMISSKVAGNSQGYSWNRIGDTELKANFYHNLLKIDGLTQRGFVSPISQNSFLFYDYKLEGEIKEGNRIINKIQVIPKRKSDPVFKGYIYIVDDTWNITGIDLELGENQIEFFQNFKIQQDYVAINDSIWMPASVKYQAQLKALGFGASFVNVVNYANYEINREFPQFFFKNEVFKIETQANKRDSSYWKTTRPVLLTADEMKYYLKADSTERVQTSKEYLDSVDMKRNKFGWTSLLLGYTYYRRYNETRYSTNPLIDILNFNTVEGANVNFIFTFRKGKWNQQNFTWATHLRYGFSNGHFNPKTELNWSMNRFKQQFIGIEGGKYVSQINTLNSVDRIINTYYSLFLRENYMKLYEKTYAKINYKQELTNGIYFSGNVGYEFRHGLRNRTNFAFVNEDENRRYTSNNPLDPFSLTTFDSPVIEDHQALLFNGELRFVINQKYSTMPHGKEPHSSKYPVFSLKYAKGAPLLDSDVNFDLASVTVNDNFNFGLLGKSTWNVSVGGFLNKHSVPFVDYKHFNGNQTIFLNLKQPTGNFQLLDYYTNSTTSSYIEAHYEHHFNGFIFNKIPLLRKTKFQEVAGVNFLRTEDNREHVELQLGVENIAKFFRVDFVTGYNNVSKVQGAIRLRFGIDLF
ncbi:MAG TPA: DUF5686 and carboxypeptidase regulatory-like domain-containing protein [Cytophagales bacterium]|nr:DUF5686 and carboxypeptidase regulatory-like domain-containing protein [Cytophagales bacterium]